MSSEKKESGHRLEKGRKRRKVIMLSVLGSVGLAGAIGAIGYHGVKNRHDPGAKVAPFAHVGNGFARGEGTVVLATPIDQEPIEIVVRGRRVVEMPIEDEPIYFEQALSAMSRLSSVDMDLLPAGSDTGQFATMSSLAGLASLSGGVAGGRPRNGNEGIQATAGEEERSSEIGQPETAQAPVEKNTPQIVSAVPELSTWVMMIGGFGMIGIMLRRRKRTEMSA